MGFFDSIQGGLFGDPDSRTAFSHGLMGLGQGLMSQQRGENWASALGRGFGGFQQGMAYGRDQLERKEDREFQEMQRGEIERQFESDANMRRIWQDRLMQLDPTDPAAEQKRGQLEMLLGMRPGQAQMMEAQMMQQQMAAQARGARAQEARGERWEDFQREQRIREESARRQGDYRRAQIAATPAGQVKQRYAEGTMGIQDPALFREAVEKMGWEQALMSRAFGGTPAAEPRVTEEDIRQEMIRRGMLPPDPVALGDPSQSGGFDLQPPPGTPGFTQ